MICLFCYITVYHNSVLFKGGFVQKPVNNAYWNKPQWEPSAPEVDERLWQGPPIEPVPSLIAGKETYDYGHMHDNQPLAMQSIDYNHMSEFSYNQVKSLCIVYRYKFYLMEIL